ncbi:MAG: hypothetical protein AB9879_05545 [Methanothrix sp.]
MRSTSRSNVYAFILLCAVICGCMESPTTLSPSATIPSPYYAKADPWLDHSIFGVETLIGSGIIRKYDINVFDCSEMAAYLEWMLEKHGFDAKICLADRFANGSIAHAWVAIDIPPKRYYVEPTALNTGGFIFSTIKPYDGNYRDYSRYDSIHEDIYDITRSNPLSEFDWWNDPRLAKNLKDAHDIHSEQQNGG